MLKTNDPGRAGRGPAVGRPRAGDQPVRRRPGRPRPPAGAAGGPRGGRAAHRRRSRPPPGRKPRRGGRGRPQGLHPRRGQEVVRMGQHGGAGQAEPPRRRARGRGGAGAGDDVALWLVENGETRLSDPDALAAFCDSPLDVSLGLQPLDKLAAAYRANRLSAGNQAERGAVQPTAPQHQQQPGGTQQGGVPAVQLRPSPTGRSLPSSASPPPSSSPG